MDTSLTLSARQADTLARHLFPDDGCEAVAIGCVFVAELASRASGLSTEVVERHRDAFSRVGLPVSYSAASFEDLLATMRVDKKSRGAQLRFVVLSDVGVPTVLAGPSQEHLREAFEAIAGSPS